MYYNKNTSIFSTPCDDCISTNTPLPRISRCNCIFSCRTFRQKKRSSRGNTTITWESLIYNSESWYQRALCAPKGLRAFRHRIRITINLANTGNKVKVCPTTNTRGFVFNVYQLNSRQEFVENFLHFRFPTLLAKNSL